MFNTHSIVHHFVAALRSVGIGEEKIKKMSTDLVSTLASAQQDATLVAQLRGIERAWSIQGSRIGVLIARGEHRAWQARLVDVQTMTDVVGMTVEHDDLAAAVNALWAMTNTPRAHDSGNDPAAAAALR